LHLSAKQRNKSKKLTSRAYVVIEEISNGKTLAAKEITLRHRIQGRGQTIDVVFIIARLA
jgi:hypothetical protein